MLHGRWLAFLVIVSLSVSCSDAFDDHYDKVSSTDAAFISVLKANGSGLFADKLVAYKYDAFLGEARPFTVMAPKDAAFAALTNGMTDDEVKMVLLFHIFDGAMSSDKFVAGKIMFSINRKRVECVADKNFKGYNGNFGGIEKPDVEVNNGFVHVLSEVFVPALSLGDHFAAHYSKFGDIFQFFSTVNEDAVQGRTIINQDGHSDVVQVGIVNYDYFNPYNESLSYTVLPFSNQVYDKTFGQLEWVLRGNEVLEEEKANLFNQFITSHIFPGIIDSAAMVSKLNKNFLGIPATLPQGAIVAGNRKASNGMVHGVDTVFIKAANIKARVDEYYKKIDFNIGNANDVTLANSSRSNNTLLSKADELAIWTKNPETTKEGGYLFFTLSKELAAADYKVFIEHEVDSGYTDIVSISVNDQVINPNLQYDDSLSVVAGTLVNLLQEVGMVSFDTYQKGTKVRIDIVNERNGDNTMPNDVILKLKRITFEPWQDEETD